MKMGSTLPGAMEEAGDDAGGGAGVPGSPYPEEVEVLELDGRRIVLVGTAHVSRESVELVRQVIEQERPDAV